MNKYGVCQSCGMPLKSIGDFGMEKDGKASKAYCCYCYKDGKFIDEDMTKDEMMKKVSVVLQSKMFVSKEKADSLSVALIKYLKRWN